jgi:hypothetical protein
MSEFKKQLEDLTWPICRGCKHRVAVEIHSTQIRAYVCQLGLDRDKNPNRCPLYEDKATYT